MSAEERRALIEAPLSIQTIGNHTGWGGHPRGLGMLGGRQLSGRGIGDPYWTSAEDVEWRPYEEQD